MEMKLSEDDALAVDLMLDRSSATGGNSATFAAPAGDSVVERIGAVETVMRLLAEMPAADPPADLAQRTIERIEHSGGIGHGAIEGILPIIPQEPA
jgi:hypothetical protein